MTKRIALILASLIAVALFAVGCGGSDSADNSADGSPNSEATEVGSPTVTGEPLAPVPESGDDPAVGEKAPQVSSVDFTGADVEMLTEGTPAVVLVAAHWCPHCQADVEALRTFFDEGNTFAEGVDFVVLHTWPAQERGNWPASAWLEGLGDRTVLDDATGTAATALGLTATPMWVAVDGDGNVVARQVGEVAPATIAGWTEELAAT